MKIVIVGAGAFRVLSIIRGAMQIPGILDGGEVNLYDLNVSRTETMGRLLQKTPEFRRARPKITWGSTLEEALEGADVVGVIMPAMSARAMKLCHIASAERGFCSSDNLSFTGAMAGVNIAPVLLNLARKMERHCPEALLLDFVNPVAVLSGMINNHTRIQALGVCAGFTNHQWDIPRICGEDEGHAEIDPLTAGVNHMSFITGGSWNGRPLLEVVDQAVRDPNWEMPAFKEWWTPAGVENMKKSVTRLRHFWKTLGVLVFSSEGDGMDHLEYEKAAAEFVQSCPRQSLAEVDAEAARWAAQRQEDDRTFTEYAKQELDDAFWAERWKTDHRLKLWEGDIFARLFEASAGLRPICFAASNLNRGVIAGIKDRHVVEYTQVLDKKEIQPVGNLEIPDVVYGITAALANHQTMLGDALALEDPEMLARALMAYPIANFSDKARDLYKTEFEILGESVAAPYRAAARYL